MRVTDVACVLEVSKTEELDTFQLPEWNHEKALEILPLRCVLFVSKRLCTAQTDCLNIPTSEVVGHV